MSIIRKQWALAILMILIVGAMRPANAQGVVTAPDSTLYTTYTVSSDLTSVNWIVCGSTQQTEGCYASGQMGPFGKVGALMEGIPVINGDKVTRGIYIVDTGSASAKLTVYKKIDTVTAETDTVSVTLAKTVTLPLAGGSSAVASMAANSRFLFIGTDQSSQAVEVLKSNLTFTQIGGFSPPINVSAITADSYGYVTVTFGTFSGGESGFYVFGPNGELEEDGGGAPFMLDTREAVVPTSFFNSNTESTLQVGTRPKAHK
jgi:hypothetical protein